MRARRTAVCVLVLVTALTPLSPWSVIAAAIRGASLAATRAETAAPAREGALDRAEPGLAPMNGSRIGHPQSPAPHPVARVAELLPPRPVAAARPAPAAPTILPGHDEHPPSPPRAPPV